MMKRTARSVFLVAIGVFVGVSLAGITVYAQRPGGPPGGGGRGGGGFGGFNPMSIVERAVQGSWSVVSFELDTTDEQLAAVRKVYQESIAETKVKAEAMGELDPNNRREAMQGLMEGQRELREATKTHLDDAQNAKLDEWYQEQANAAQRRGGGGRRGRGGRGGEGGEGGEGRERRQRD
jgi:hypothetical protein